ncbi:MAG: hypothetical protein ABIJ57_14535, partial [Pseudomonadota bacterium]
MTDPLGLLSNLATSDPLGLLAKPRPIPELRSDRGEPNVRDIVSRYGSLGGVLSGEIYDIIERFGADKPAERAKAANAVTISETYGIPPSVAYEHMDEITKQIGMRDQPTFRELVEAPIVGGVVYGLLSHPLATVIGVTAFAGLAEAENYLVSKSQLRSYRFGAGRGLAEMLPEETEQGFKDLVWTADMAWKAVAAGGAIKVGKPAIEQFAIKYMRDMTEMYRNLPRTIFISPEKIREFHGLGREEIITPEEVSMLKDMGLTRQQYMDSLKYGLDLEIPGETLVKIVDKPWWAAMKKFFRASPYEETIVTKGEAGARKHVAGLLEEPVAGLLERYQGVETTPEVAGKVTKQPPGEVLSPETGKPVGEIVQPRAKVEAKSITAEDFELRPDKMKDFQEGVVSFKVGDEIISAKVGSKVN